MGWDIDLVDENGLVQVPRQNAGSIISISSEGLVGTTEASMSITYNYSRLYRLVINESLKDYLRNKIAKDTIPTLKLLIEKLGTDQYKRPRDNYSYHGGSLKEMIDSQVVDYWAPTMGNAGSIAAILLDWAQLHPQAKWEIGSE